MRFEAYAEQRRQATKNVLQLFAYILSICEAEVRYDVIDVLSALRGPDGWRERTPITKLETTAVIRATAFDKVGWEFGAASLGSSVRVPKEWYEAKKNDDFYRNHFFGHIIAAAEALGLEITYIEEEKK